jgi:hypothetical protein
MAKTHVLITHSAEDKIYKDELLLHLSSQKDDGKASFWDRDAISPGTEEAPELAGQLKKADIILLLLSADFFNSDYCLEVEKKAFALQKVKKVLVVPVMLRHFDLGAKYDSRATIPDRKRPILGKTWDSEDEAFNPNPQPPKVRGLEILRRPTQPRPHFVLGAQPHHVAEPIRFEHPDKAGHRHPPDNPTTHAA